MSNAAPTGVTHAHE